MLSSATGLSGIYIKILFMFCKANVYLVLGLFIISLQQISFEDVGKISTSTLLRNHYSRNTVIKMLVV